MTNPTLVSTPFAENGDKNLIPETNTDPGNPQLASMSAGFPPITQQKISEGGIPPERDDFNGILNLYGQHIVHLNKGLPYEFDQDFANLIGGYPLNSRLMLSNGDIVQSTIVNNVNNPNSDLTGWIKKDSISIFESIADLPSSYKNNSIGYVRSYILGQNKGGGLFYFDSELAEINNGVTVFNGWVRIDFDNPSVYQAGILGNETDCYIALQKITDIAVNKRINLEGLSLKFSQLDIPSNTYFYNGTMDCSISTWQNTYGRTAIMLKSTDRNATGVDYEVKENYEAIIESKNITFENIHFVAQSQIGLFFKFDGLSFIDCSAEWGNQDLFKFVGGINGTVLVNDTPTSYNLIDPINGRNKNILIDNFVAKGGYVDSTFSNSFHFAGCENVVINGGNYDCTLGIKIDIYNKNIELNNFNYINTNQQLINDAIANTGDPEMYAIYIGQNCYDIRINGGIWRDFAKKGIYIEVGSLVVIDGVNASCKDANSVARFADLQPNYRDNTNTFWGNVANITIKNCIVNGVKYGIGTSPFNSAKSLKDINLINNIINTNSVFDAITFTGTESYLVEGCICNGNLTLLSNNGANSYIKQSSFVNDSNYALYIAHQDAGMLPSICDTDFIVGTGSPIYNNGGSSKSGSIIRGKIASGSGAQLMQLGTAANIVCYDFENGVTQRAQAFPQNINLEAGATSATIIKSISGVREGWIPNLTIHGIVAFGFDLTITCSAEVDGISFKIKNNGATAVNFTPNMLLKLNSFCDQVFRN